jgi:sugar lactone lactonase YvrE
MDSLKLSVGFTALVAAIVVGCVGLQDASIAVASPAIPLAPIQVDPAWFQDEPDTYVPKVCKARDNSVPSDFGVLEPGWTIGLFYDGLVQPGSLHATADGTVYVGAKTFGSRHRVVARIRPDGSLTTSQIVLEPDGVAVDSSGAAWTAGHDRIVRLGSLDGGPDTVWHRLKSGGTIDDVIIDSQDRFVVSTKDGRILRVDQNKQETQLLPGRGRVRMTLDKDGNVWVVRKEIGKIYLYSIDAKSLVVRSEALLTDQFPRLIEIRDLSFGPKGRLYMVSQVAGPDPSVILAWDIENSGDIFPWATGLSAGDNEPSELTWSESGNCLYFSSPPSARIFRICGC